jgi:hypothetical protein
MEFDNDSPLQMGGLPARSRKDSNQTQADQFAAIRSGIHRFDFESGNSGCPIETLSPDIRRLPYRAKIWQA